MMETVVTCDETQKLHSGRDPNPASDRENKIDKTDTELDTENHARARKIICDTIRERQASLQSLEDSLECPPVVKIPLKSTKTPDYNWENANLNNTPLVLPEAPTEEEIDEIILEQVDEVKDGALTVTRKRSPLDDGQLKKLIDRSITRKIFST